MCEEIPLHDGRGQEPRERARKRRRSQADGTCAGELALLPGPAPPIRFFPSCPALARSLAPAPWPNPHPGPARRFHSASAASSWRSPATRRCRITARSCWSTRRSTGASRSVSGRARARRAAGEGLGPGPGPGSGSGRSLLGQLEACSQVDCLWTGRRLGGRRGAGPAPATSPAQLGSYFRPFGVAMQGISRTWCILDAEIQRLAFA